MTRGWSEVTFGKVCTEIGILLLGAEDILEKGG